MLRVCPRCILRDALLAYSIASEGQSRKGTNSCAKFLHPSDARELAALSPQ